ncbi:unnamed protein product [Bursaphelenchus xylophilus]|uniref:Protein MON2 homolog n=1 Tax=Bursaphelenchus xylophilus TaxID=6326 RepID=A0A1I7RHA3_BURXY|nr:unnamed protein product [Bursaphelenchus xylophilus]CAG9115898.1 unnamed protein product [Bursaphelenchus xylophilus]
MSGDGAQTSDSAKLIEYLLSDLRSLSTEAKKKHTHVKDAAESCLVKVRNISTNSQPHSLLQNMRSGCNEILHPMILGCSTRVPKLVQISLQGIQHMLQYRVVSPNSASTIVNELWNLAENECEELRVLQTVTSFVNSELLVTDGALARCIVLSIKLNFSKDPSVINAANAAVRQLFSCVFERVIQEDGMKGAEMTIVSEIVREHSSQAPPTLRPCAADGYMLLRDLCALVKREQPVWLEGVQRITLTLSLELLEAILKNYPSIFFKHAEYADLLKNSICPQLVKLFAQDKDVKVVSQLSSRDAQYAAAQLNRRSVSSLSSASIQSNSSQRPYFSVIMRALRITYILISFYHKVLALQCEILISFLLELLSQEHSVWQSAVSLEVLHRLTVQPELMGWLCENFDMKSDSTPLVANILAKLKGFILKTLEAASIDETLKEKENQSLNTFGQTGFVFNGAFIPLNENLSAKRWMILEWLDKHDPASVPEGYNLSVAYFSLVDLTHSIYAVVEEDNSPSYSLQNKPTESQRKSEVASQLYLSSYKKLIEGLTLLLECSIDDSITEAVLNCLSTIMVMGCKVGNSEARDATVRAICKASLPHGYFGNYVEPCSPANIEKHREGENNNINQHGKNKNLEESAVIGEPSQVVVMSTVCPVPSLTSAQANLNVMLTAKNLQVGRLLINAVQSCGDRLLDSWEVVLATLQHFFWILGIKPTPNGAFKVDTSAEGISATNGGAIVTTAVSSELPELNSLLNKLFESTSGYDETSLHYVIAGLSKLSNDSMIVGSQNPSKEPSLFPLARLLQTAENNLKRFTIFWRPITSHLLEICVHPNAILRDWGSVCLTSLIKNALNSLGDGKDEEEQHVVKQEQLIMNPLAMMSDSEYVDVRSKQLDCLLNVLQSDRHHLHPQLWPTVIEIVTTVVDQRTIANAELVDQGFGIVKLMIKEFLSGLPLECVQLVVETDSKYGHQQLNMNISLAAVGLLWDISDFVSGIGHTEGSDNVEKMWLVIYNCLSELCVDARPPVRKSACDTLLQTVAAHGHTLKANTWSHMVWKILFPMLDKVRVETKNASTKRSDSSALGAPNMILHHSRDTESKQWAETTVRTLGGVVKIFNAQRNTLLELDTFENSWKTLLTFIEYVAGTDNSEMSLAALKNFQELLFGRAQSGANPKKKKNGSVGEEQALPLPEKLWMISWRAFTNISKAITSPTIPEASLSTVDVMTSASEYPKHFIPGTFHFTTLLSAFQPLFYRVCKRLEPNDVGKDGILAIFKRIVSTPMSPDQGPFMMTTQNSEINPSQECILDCVYVIFQEQTEPNSKLRPAIPDLLKMLLEFVGFSIRPPVSGFVQKDKQVNWAQQNLISFAELSLRTSVAYFSKVYNFPEVLQQLVFVDFIHAIREPLSQKYQCPSQTTWKIAANFLIQVCGIGLPMARDNALKFSTLWPVLADTIEGFLFTKTKSETPLSADERKRHEYIDCQVIELIRVEILPYASQLPREFMQRVIEILNRGSINTMDPNDVLASDSFQQRADLSRVCFDALLSMSKGGEDENGKKNSVLNSLGSAAISSLLNRCKQVLNNYARDEQGAGHFRLPQERIFEMISVLRAISTLIDGLTKHPEAVHSSLYQHLVSLHPNLVQLIPSCRSDQQIELALMTALNSYQTLLLINIHNRNL